MARSSIPSQWPWALAGAALGLAAAVLLFAPAQWLAGALVRASGGHVLLHDARGTVWNGSAQLLLAGGQGSSAAIALPSRLDWQLRPAWGGADLALSSACCTPQAMALQVRARSGQRPCWPAWARPGTPCKSKATCSWPRRAFQ